MGGVVNITGGNGTSTGTGAAGGNVVITGGSAGGSAANNGGSITFAPGAATSTGTAGSVVVTQSAALAWGSSGVATPDLFLTRNTTATLQLGVADADTNALIVAQTIRSQGLLTGGTTNQAGKDFTIIVSPGKGTGAGGQFIVQTAPAGASSSTPNTALSRFIIAPTGIFTLNTVNYASCTALTTNASAVLGCTVSDERLKQNISPLIGRGLATIRNITPITYSFRETFAGQPNFYYEGGKLRLGLSAQNLQTASPLLASTFASQGLLQPEPLALHAIEIDAIKSLDARVTALEAEVVRLLMTVERLRRARRK